MTMKQISFPTKTLKKRRVIYGGLIKEKGRKLARPVAVRRDMHIVLKSDKAKGELSLYKFRFYVDAVLRSKAKKFGVAIKQVINMGNHLHLHLRVENRDGLGQFLKAVTCLIARQVTGARRGKKFGRFWQGLAFSRIITSAFEALSLDHYLKANRIEFRQGYHARTDYLNRVHIWMRRLKKQDGIATAL